MNRRRTLLLAACLLFIAAPTSADEQPQPATANQPRLQLANGDYLAGRLSTSDQADVIAWQTDFAAEPLRFPVTYVNGIHFAKHQPAAAEGEFAFELTGGDGLSGQLKRLDDKTIEIQSKSLGSLTLDRAQVHRIVRLAKDQQVRYRGPDGLTGWQVAAGNWTEQAGRLTADKPASAFLHEFPIPKRASIELELSWKTKPDFTLSFGGLSPVLNAAANNVRRVINGAIVVNARPQPQQQKSSPTVFSLECWKNSLVLVRELDKAADLALVQSLEETAGSLRLHILYDEETGHVAVYSQAGALLAEVTVSGEGSPKVGGVNLVNKTGDITLEHLVIQEWLGDLPAKVDLAKPTLRRKDGAIVDGAKATFDAAAQQFIIARENAAPATIPAADVQELSLNPRNLAHVQIDLAERPLVASLLDGTRLSGRVLAVSEKSLKLKRPGLKDPVDLPLDLIRSMATSSVKPHPQRPDGRYGRLQTMGSSIKGALVDAQSSDDQPALAWQPQGALNAAPLAPGLSAAIYYREPPKRSAKPKLTQQEQLRRRLLAQQQIVVQQRQPGLLGIINGNRAARTRATLPLLAEELLWLKAGDRLTCKLKSIDERGITFESPLVESTFLPHEAVKAWERAKSRDDLNADKRERLLTLPRMQRPNPPTHLVESIDGDLIRGRLQSMDADSMTLEVRLEPKQIPFERVARIIWLDAPKKDDPKKDDPKKVEAAARPEEQPAQPAAEVELYADAVVLEPFDASLEEVDPDRPEPEQPPAAKLDVVLPPNSVQVVREDGVRLTFVPDRVAQGAIDGKSDLLGHCHVDLQKIDALYIGEAIKDAAQELPYHQWQLHPARDPQFVAEDGSPTPAAPQSTLAGEPAPDFKLELLDGGQFRLSQERGKAVVLDFWASWCGPCMKTMPLIDEVSKDFADGRVRFFAVNMQEDKKTVKDALERLNVKPTVALDTDGAAAEKYAVTAIPQTVVINGEGKVAAVFVGGSSDFPDKLREAIKAALDPAATTKPSDPKQ